MQSHDAHLQRRCLGAPDPDGAIKMAGLFRPLQLTYQIERLTAFIKPARVAPTAADEHVSALFDDSADLVNLKKGCIRYTNLAGYDRNPVDTLAALLIC